MIRRNRIIIALSVFILFTSALFAQSVEGGIARSVSFFQAGKSVKIEYRIPAPATVYVYVSLDAGRTFRGPLQMVSGDVGIVATKGTKSVVWNPLEEYGEIVSNQVCFRVIAIPFEQVARDVEKATKASSKGSSLHVWVDAFGTPMSRITTRAAYASNKTIGFSWGASLSAFYGGPRLLIGGGASCRTIPGVFSSTSTESSVTIKNSYYYNDWFPCVFADLLYVFNPKSRPFLRLQAGGGYYWSSFIGPFASVGAGIHPLRHLYLQLSADYFFFQAHEKNVIHPAMHLGISF